ncbi:unnamed protein product [Ixodes persulcatus]
MTVHMYRSRTPKKRKGLARFESCPRSRRQLISVQEQQQGSYEMAHKSKSWL